MSLTETQHRPFSAHVTVAAIICNERKQYLLVEEEKEGRRVYNQPAGHLEANEDLIQACAREVLEETGYKVRVESLVGIGLFTAPNGEVYHRSTFYCEIIEQIAGGPLDKDIIDCCWLSLQDIQQKQDQLRSPLVLRAIEQYESGHRYPLTMLYP